MLLRNFATQAKRIVIIPKSITGDKTMKIKDLTENMVPIKDFNVDIKSLVDSIYIGPQGELSQLVEMYNRQYGTKLGLTKQFNFKPGSYNEIKAAYARKVLKWSMRPRGLRSIFERMDRFRWNASHFKRDTLKLENKMKELKTLGLRWQDNTEDMVKEYDKLIDIIDGEMETVKALYPNVDIDFGIAGIGRSMYGDMTRNFRDVIHPDSKSTINFMLTFRLIFTNVDMHIAKTTTEGVEDYIVSGDGTMVVYTGVPLFTVLSNLWGKDTVVRQNNAVSTEHALSCAYFNKFGLNKHPYVSLTYDQYMLEMDGINEFQFSHICKGNMNADLGNSLLNMQLAAHVTHIYNWLYNYFIPQTNPLVNFRYLKRCGSHDLQNIQPTYNDNYSMVGSADNESMCTFIGDLSHAIYNYSKARTPENITLNLEGSVADRANDYIQRIEVSDMPCMECELKKDCTHFEYLDAIYGESDLTPEMEAILGEIYDYDRAMNIAYDERFFSFVEGSIRDVHQSRLDDTLARSYKLYMFNFIVLTVVKTMKEVDLGEDIKYNTVFRQHHQHMNGSEHIEDTYEFMLKHERTNKYVFDTYFVSDLLHGQPARKAVERAAIREQTEPVSEEANIDSVFEAVEAGAATNIVPGGEVDIDPVTAPGSIERFHVRVVNGMGEVISASLSDVLDDTEDNLSAEERSLQWATEMGGGSQNL